MNKRNILLLAVSSLMFTTANAALFDRGNGLIYDSTLNITWLQDFDYAKTSGYDTDGALTYNQAKFLLTI